MLNIKFANFERGSVEMLDEFCSKFMERENLSGDIYITTAETDISFSGELIIINGFGKGDDFSGLAYRVFAATGINTYTIGSKNREIRSKKTFPVLNVFVATEKVKEVIAKLKKMNLMVDTLVHFSGAGYHKFTKDLHIQLSATMEDIELLGYAQGILFSLGFSGEQINIDVLADFIPKSQMKFP